MTASPTHLTHTLKQQNHMRPQFIYVVTEVIGGVITWVANAFDEAGKFIGTVAAVAAKFVTDG